MSILFRLCEYITRGITYGLFFPLTWNRLSDGAVYAALAVNMFVLAVVVMAVTIFYPVIMWGVLSTITLFLWWMVYLQSRYIIYFQSDVNIGFHIAKWIFSGAWYVVSCLAIALLY